MDRSRHFLLDGGAEVEVCMEAGRVGGGSCSDTMSDGERLILSTARHTAGIERQLNIDAAGRNRVSCTCTRHVREYEALSLRNIHINAAGHC